MGLEWGRLHGKPKIGAPDLESFETAIGTARLAVDFDGMDDPLFPRRGVMLAMDAQASRPALGADDDFERIDLEVHGAATLGRTTFVGTGTLASALTSTLPAHVLVGLGGLLRLSGYRQGEIYGNHLAFGRLLVLQEVRDGAYLGLSLEAGNAWALRSQVRADDLRHSVAGILGLRTLLGPVYLGVGSRGSGTPYWYLEVGHAL